MLKFYRCNICGNLVEVIDESGVTPVCCGQSMELLEPGTSDGVREKHLPVITSSTNTSVSYEDIACELRSLTVRVGEFHHPMSKEHSIQWILLHTDQGIYRKNLSPEQTPEAEFLLNETEEIIAIYAYCNLHGLWMNKG